ncbi:hypothetical protein M885DRAFT_549775 [Pelagophyceae sp. CCMP2097]|nr:hypothetical protein M885DRAFT_549775 [Pelagophyceae sp. CCMP2097]
MTRAVQGRARTLAVAWLCAAGCVTALDGARRCRTATTTRTHFRRANTALGAGAADDDDDLDFEAAFKARSRDFDVPALPPTTTQEAFKNFMDSAVLVGSSTGGAAAAIGATLVALFLGFYLTGGNSPFAAAPAPEAPASIICLIPSNCQ